MRPGTPKRIHTLFARIREGEKAKVLAACTITGVSISEFVRDSVLLTTTKVLASDVQHDATPDAL